MSDEEDPESMDEEDLESMDEEDPMCDAILVTQSMFGGDDYMKMQAKVAFEEELKKEQLEVEHVRGEVYVGNRRGLDLAGMKAKLSAHESKICFLEACVQDLKTNAEDLKNNVKALTGRVSVLSIAAKEYKWVRQRSLSTFKRDHLPDTMEQSDYDIIRTVNQTVHEGDVVVDAFLYEEGGRRDTHTFEELYGLHPAIVRTIANFSRTPGNIKHPESPRAGPGT
ncbi:hypothetical protein C7212DRAFT_365686 [Tuber magnatum]|uniref:Uncharacterized protein n=1 Tax=Tuber magnatum TaxID=42249 RepID=A0A317SJZ3_9PEZI|nr:hypothetical protein C7212DRAFT_365686 [Tuber magnatum]